MAQILTLISSPFKKVLSVVIINQCKTVLGCGDDAIRTLNPGIAVEFTLDKALPDLARLDALLADLPVDVCRQQAPLPTIKVFIADMDSTIIRQECLDEMAVLAGIGPEIAAITERAMAGELNFEAALKERVALLAGQPASIMEQVINDRISLSDGARTLVQTLKARGIFTALVSGGFTFFTHRIAQAVGFDDNQGNVLEVERGEISGKVLPPIFGQEAKFEALQRYCHEMNCQPENVMAIGDGANDIDMVKAAGLGIGFHPKPALAKSAQCSIRHGDLTALLYLMGINVDQFVGD
jgi:phosphoserine phosphatase